MTMLGLRLVDFSLIEPEFVPRLMSMLVHHVYWVSIVVGLDIRDEITVLTFNTCLHYVLVTHLATPRERPGEIMVTS